jgi:serine/threonine-protein kinase
MADPIRDQLQASLGEGYAFERELGGGGMSRVFLARDLRLERSVVVKALSADLAAGISAERFTREIKLAAALQEPHIVPVLSDGVTADGTPYYVMPFVRGASLRERMARGSVPIAEAIGILRDVAKALAYAHRAGIVHRDIKPENILLSEGTAVVADFGIAKAVEAATHGGAARATGLTTAGVAIGTPAYMAPEQAVADASVDQRADLYALGVIAYELLTGSHPFAGRTAQALMAAHLTETPVRLGQRRADSPPALDALVTRLLAKDPASRPASADVVVEALDLATGEQHPARSGRRVVLAMVGVALVVLGGAFAAWRWSARSSEASTTGAGRMIHTVAVLPFVNTSGSADDEYFSDGLTDELAHALSRVPGLRIAGRTSSYTFKGRAVAAQEIGRTLDVGAFVNGTTRRAGDRLRVTTQLVSTTDGKVMWDSVYESRSGDVFAVQDSLTHAIVASLAPMLGGGVPDVHLADRARGTSDQEAYDLYLKGRYYWLQRGETNISRSIELFRAAVARDSSFARAHAALAMAYATAPMFGAGDGSGTPASRIERAAALTEASARRAAALDSTLADAQLALAVSQDYQLRFEDALARYRQAVALDPSSATARHWLGMSLLNLGRTDEAIEELRRGTDLDPLALMPSAALGTALLYGRRFPDAVTQARRSLALDSTLVFSILTLSESQALAGAPDSAIATAERGLRLHPGNSRLLVALLFAQAAAGRWDDAGRIRARLRAEGDRTGSADPAIAELVFGDRMPLLGVLASREGQRRYVGSGSVLGCDPMLDPLRSDARFVAAMRSLSVAPCPVARPWPIAPRPTH